MPAGRQRPGEAAPLSNLAGGFGLAPEAQGTECFQNHGLGDAEALGGAGGGALDAHRRLPSYVPAPPSPARPCAPVLVRVPLALSGAPVFVPERGATPCAQGLNLDLAVQPAGGAWGRVRGSLERRARAVTSTGRAVARPLERSVFWAECACARVYTCGNTWKVSAHGRGRTAPALCAPCAACVWSLASASRPVSFASASWDPVSGSFPRGSWIVLGVAFLKLPLLASY